MTKQAPRYQFSEIPNTPDGRAVIEDMKKYLNRDRYQIVVKGQYMNKQARAEWRRYERGQPIAMSTHLRVYINEVA